MINSKKFKKLAAEKNFTMFVGSAISSFSPSDMESGGTVVNSLCENLLGNDSERLCREKNILLNSAFEVLFEHYPNKSHLLKSLQSSYSKCNPNPIHESIAKLMIQGRVTSVVTTNYDCGIEEAYRKISSKELLVVVDDQSVPVNAAKKTPILFKIHGCTGHFSTIIATLKDEAELPQWKKTLIHNLLDSSNLLVTGYSGLDFEVCPELAKVNLSSLYWNCRGENSKTANSDIVVAEQNGHYVYGDMCDILSVFGERVTAVWGAKKGNLANTLIQELNDYEKHLWITKLLVNQSCANAALEYSKKLRAGANGDDEIRESDSLYLSSLYHLAKHSTAVKERKRIRTTIDSSNPYYMQLLYSDAGNLYTSGRYIGCFVRCRESEAYASEDVTEEHITVLNSLPWMYALLYSVPLRSVLYRWAFILIGKNEEYRNKVIDNLSKTCDNALKNGNWGSIYLCNDLAEKLRIPQSLYLNNSYLVPTAEKGFKQMGNVVGQMTALLHVPDTEKYEEHFKKVNEYIELSKYLGLNSATQLLITEMVKFESSKNLKNIKNFMACLSKCEFSFFAKVHYTIVFLKNYFSQCVTKKANK